MRLNSNNDLHNLPNPRTDMSTKINTNYSINTGSKWIYCNGPERIEDKALGDNGKCINQITVPAGEHQLFYSHRNNTNKRFTYGIQIYNPNSRNLTFTIHNYGHSVQGKNGVDWMGCSLEPWKQFFRGGTSNHIVPHNAPYMITETVDANDIFSGVLRFHVDEAAIVTVYAYIDINKLDGRATKFDVIPSVDGRQWSGYGNGYFLMQPTITINVSELQTNNKYLECAFKGNPEIRAIYNDNGTLIVGRDSNLANWGAQYYFPIKLHNDTSATKTINIYSQCNAIHNFNMSVINSGGFTNGAYIGDRNPNSWKFASITLRPGETIHDAYQFILGTNSCEGNFHIFSLR